MSQSSAGKRLQHGVGDGPEARELARNGDTGSARGAGRSRCRRSARKRRAERLRHRARRHAADRHARCRRQLVGARRCAIRLQQERREIDVALGTEAARRRRRRRHRHAQERDELLRAARVPGAHEIGTYERPRLVGAAQVGEVAACAIREIRRSARGGLRLGERAGLGMGDARQRRCSDREAGASAACRAHGSNQPQRLPSGAVSLCICR